MSGLASIDANAYGAGLLAVALGGYLVASSFTTLVNRQEEYLQKWGTTGSQSLQSLGTQLWNLLTLVVIGLGTSIAGIINHVVAWKWFYISLFIIGAYGEGIVRWQPNGQREYDAINTEFVQPQYNAVVINIGNAIRIAYDASWCWYNTYVVGYRDIPKELFLTAIICARANLQQITNSLATAIAFTFLETGQWIAANGTRPLNVTGIVALHAHASVAVYLTIFIQVAYCWCDTLSFIWDALDKIIVSPHLALWLNAATNFWIELAQQAFGFITFLWLVQGYSCTGNIQCNARPPNLTAAMSWGCLWGYELGKWVDTILTALLDGILTFIISPVPPNILPPLYWVIGYLVCFFVQYTLIPVEIVLHVDLIFTNDYLAYYNWEPIFDNLFNASYGIFVSFDSYNVSFITDLGCTISALVNFTTEVSRFIFFTALQVITDPVTIPTFLVNWNFTQADLDLAQALNCFVDFTKEVNLPLAQIIQYGGQAFTQFWKVFVKFAGLVFDATALNTYVSQGGLRNDTRLFIFYLNGTGIALGNFWRQFDTFSHACGIFDPANQIQPYGDDGNFFCCFGNAFQAVWQLLVALTDYWILLGTDILEGQSFSTIVCNGDLDFTRHLIPTLESFNRWISCIPFSFMQFWGSGGNCPGTGTQNVVDTFASMGAALLNITTYPFYFLQLIVNIIKASLNQNCYGIPCSGNPGCQAGIITCLIVLGLYDFTAGQIASVFFQLANIFACAISGQTSGTFQELGTTIWDLFGWDGGSGNIRVTICAIIAGIIEIVTFIACFFKDDAGQVLTCLAQFSGLDTLITALETTFNCINQFFTVTVSQCVSGFFQQFFPQLFACAGALFTGPKCKFNFEGCTNVLPCSFSPSAGPPVLPTSAARNFSAASRTSAAASRHPVYRNAPASVTRHPRFMKHYGLPYVDYGGQEEGIPAYFFLQSFSVDNHSVDKPCESLLGWLRASRAHKMAPDQQPTGTPPGDLADLAAYTLMTHAYKGCMMSSALVTAINGVLGEPGPETLLSPYTFVDPWLFGHVLMNVSQLPWYVWDAFNATNNVTGTARYRNWLDYANGEGLDPLTRRLGFYVSGFIWAVLKESEGPAKILSTGQPNLLYNIAEIWRMLFGGTLVDEPKPVIQGVMKAGRLALAAFGQFGPAMDALFNNTIRQLNPRVAPEVIHAVWEAKYQLGNATLRAKRYLYDRAFSRPVDPKQLRRRANLASLSKFVSLNYQDATAKYAPGAMPVQRGPDEAREHWLYKEKGYAPVRSEGSYARYQQETREYYKAQVGEETYAQWELELAQRWLCAPDLPTAQLYRDAHARSDVLAPLQARAASRQRQQPMSMASPLFAQLPPVQPVPPANHTNFQFALFTFCWDPTSCLNCTVVQNYIQVVSEQLNYCLSINQRGIQADPVAWFAGYDNCSLDTGLLNNFLLFPSTGDVPLVTGQGISLAERIANVASTIFFGAINFWATFNTIGNFVLNTDTNSQGSLLFWLKFFLTCDTQAAQRFTCGNLGLGFFTGLWVQLLTWLILTALLGYIFPGSAALFTYLWLLFFVFFPTFAYGVQPICAVFIPPTFFPLVPPTLADDIFYIFMIFYGDCFPWYRWFPGLTTPICPGAAQDYTRAFVDGTAEPYRFDLSFRSFFFLLKWQLPSVYEFIGTSPFFLFSWPLSIGSVRAAYSFPWADGTQPPDVWLSLFKLYWATLSFPLILLIFFIFSFLILFLVLRALFIFIAASLALVGVYAGDFMGGNSGGYQDIKRNYSDGRGTILHTFGTQYGTRPGQPPSNVQGATGTGVGMSAASGHAYVVTRGVEDYVDFMHDPPAYYAYSGGIAPHPPDYPPQPP